jgi:hypothetical protein
MTLRRSEKFAILASCLPLILLLHLAPPAAAQQSSSTILPQLMNAQAGNMPLHSIFLTGTVSGPNGSGATSGTVSLNASSHQWSQVALQTPSGNQTEIRNGSGLYHIRMSTGIDGVPHTTEMTDLKLPHPAWFSPSFVLLSGLASPKYWSADLGTQTWKGSTVSHVAIWQRVPSNLPASVAALAQQQTQTDVYLDPSTLLPVAMTFHVQIDPQNPNEIIVPQNATGNVLVEVDFSNYRSIQGSQIPFHVQVLNGSSVLLDINISSATINAGETTAAVSD